MFVKPQVPIRLLGGDCGILTITSVTLSDGNPAHILRSAQHSLGFGFWVLGFRV